MRIVEEPHTTTIVCDNAFPPHGGAESVCSTPAKAGDEPERFGPGEHHKKKIKKRFTH